MYAWRGLNSQEGRRLSLLQKQQDMGTKQSKPEKNLQLLDFYLDLAD